MPLSRLRPGLPKPRRIFRRYARCGRARTSTSRITTGKRRSPTCASCPAACAAASGWQKRCWPRLMPRRYSQPRECGGGHGFAIVAVVLYFEVLILTKQPGGRGGGVEAVHMVECGKGGIVPLRCGWECAVGRQEWAGKGAWGYYEVEAFLTCIG